MSIKMAATSSKPEVPTFSYAQAAKGLHAPPQPTKPVSAELGSESPNQDEQKANSSAQNAEPVTADTDAPRDAEKPAAGAEKESEPVPASKPKPNASGTSSPSVGTASTSAIGKDDDTSNTPNGTSDSTWDKQSQASVTEKPSKSAEGAKGKSKSTSEKSGKSKEPPKELKAAPLPSVNIWQQRREAQEAKAKTVPATQPTDSTVQKISAAEDQQDLSKSVSKKKDGMPDSKDRKKSDGRKGRDDGK